MQRVPERPARTRRGAQCYPVTRKAFSTFFTSQNTQVSHSAQHAVVRRTAHLKHRLGTLVSVGSLAASGASHSSRISLTSHMSMKSEDRSWCDAHAQWWACAAVAGTLLRLCLRARQWDRPARPAGDRRAPRRVHRCTGCTGARVHGYTDACEGWATSSLNKVTTVPAAGARCALGAARRRTA